AAAADEEDGGARRDEGEGKCRERARIRSGGGEVRRDNRARVAGGAGAEAVARRDGERESTRGGGRAGDGTGARVEREACRRAPAVTANDAAGRPTETGTRR